MRTITPLLLIAMLTCLAGCNLDKDNPSTYATPDADELQATPTPEPTPAPAVEDNSVRVVIETNKGDIHLAL